MNEQTRRFLQFPQPRMRSSMDVVLRMSRGQAIVEGSAFLVVFCLVAVGLMCLNLAAGTAEFYHLKVLNVADVTTRMVVSNTFWEGNQYKPKPTSLSAGQQQAISQLLQDVGLPSGSQNWSAVVSDDGNGNCIVKLTVSGLPIMSCGIFPNVISLSANAVEPWSINKPPFSVLLYTSVGPTFIPAYRPTSQVDSGAPPQYQDGGGTWGVGNSDNLMTGSISPPGTGLWGLNYAGTELAAFAPFFGTTPATPPSNSAYP